MWLPLMRGSKMDWDYFICLFTQTHCTARGLRTKTIAAYEATLRQFRDWVLSGEERVSPFGVSTRRVLEYVNHLREDRNNGDSAVNRAVTILKGFYRAMVSFGHLDPRENPLARFPKMKQTPRKLPTVLSHEEVARLLDAPAKDTVLGLRDRAILGVLRAKVRARCRRRYDGAQSRRREGPL
jgi:integrase/recombinase XerD